VVEAMSIYASNTGVSVEKSKAEIERTLARYGATAFAYAADGTRAMIKFKAANRMIMFILNLPDQAAEEFVKNSYGYDRAPDVVAKRWEQACRQKWRALALAIKAKLEAVESGISTFEEEFMAHIVMPNGKTIGQVMTPQIESAYQSGKMPALLGYDPQP
jgi:hypothetical protein